MSYAIHPYAVSIAKLKKALGSKDNDLLRQLRESFQDDFEEHDELDDELIPMTKVLAGMIGGEEPDPDAGFKYGYALKYLCEHYGTMLTNQHWSAAGFEWIETVDNALAKMQVAKQTFRVNYHLSGRGAPLKLPTIGDFPYIGYLTESEITAVSMVLSQLNDNDLDDDVRHSLAEIREWLDHCTRKHLDLVCFYH